MSTEAFYHDDPTAAPLQYYRIPVNLYRDHDMVTEDVFMLYQGGYILFRSKNTVWSDEDTKRLSDFGIQDLYVRFSSDAGHFHFLEESLSRVLHAKSTPVREKASVLYQCATTIAKDIFESPRSTETLVRSKKLVNHTISLLASDSEAFLEMISLSSHDYYTYTHCVNVMTFTIGLLTTLRYNDSKLIEETAIGAFLHDIGKAKVPLDILNKPGPLLESEWKVMKKHPEFGMDILGDRPTSERSRNIILQHHEKINGLGYPHGLQKDQIQTVSQVVSVCDAYDAMTTNRCYQRAKRPLEAFEIITQQMKGSFDTKIVEGFIQLLNVERFKKLK